MIILFGSCREDEPQDPIVEYCPSGDLRSLHTTLGNPSNAETSEAMPNNYLIEMDEYTISYNESRGIPNWVAWHLSKEWIDGDGNRQDDFRANPFLPAGWNSPNSDSYSGSGFDRGHNCPSADRLCSDNFNSATFFMTNMVPQAPNNNQEVWKYWECYLRELVDQGNELYVYMGNYGVGGDGFFGYREVITDGDINVTVPESIWKVAIAIPENDGDDINAITTQSTVIAIDIPNSENVSFFDWDDATFITTVDEIESRMGNGFDLFSNLPTNIQNTLEAQTHVRDPSFTPCW